jgi:D-alanyl-D-alanine carboxypeptidase
MAAGLADPSTGAAVSPPSRFRVASISKVLTAAAVLDLVEEGRVGLDEPVVERLAARVGAALPEPDLAQVTVRQLLTHTSGLPQGEQLYFADGSTTTCPEAARRAIESGLGTRPGGRFQYSNTNYCLLGLLLEELDGQPYEEIVRRRLLAPLGLEGMELVGTYETPPGGVVHLARPGRSFMEALGGAGAWVASASEIALLLSALDPTTPLPHPLSGPTVALMRTPVSVLPPDLDWTYGLGLRLWSDGSWGHTGTLEQTRAVAFVRPDGWTAVALVSGEQPRTSDELRALVAFALDGVTSPRSLVATPWPHSPPADLP